MQPHRPLMKHNQTVTIVHIRYFWPITIVHIRYFWPITHFSYNRLNLYVQLTLSGQLCKLEIKVCKYSNACVLMQPIKSKLQSYFHTLWTTTLIGWLRIFIAQDNRSLELTGWLQDLQHCCHSIRNCKYCDHMKTQAHLKCLNAMYTVTRVVLMSFALGI